jgi:hypothetical protein
VNARHFRAIDFEYFSKRQAWHLIAGPEHHIPRKERRAFDAGAHNDTRTRNDAFRQTCICVLKGCTETLDDTNSVLLCRRSESEWLASASELRMLRRQQSAEETRVLLHHNGRRHFRIAIAHFRPDDIEWRGEKPRRRRGAQASLMRSCVEVARRSTPEE